MSEKSKPWDLEDSKGHQFIAYQDGGEIVYKQKTHVCVGTIVDVDPKDLTLLSALEKHDRKEPLLFSPGRIQLSREDYLLLMCPDLETLSKRKLRKKNDRQIKKYLNLLS